MSIELLNLEPFQKMLSATVSPEDLAKYLNEMLIAHMRVLLHVVNENKDNNMFIHPENDDHIFYLKMLINALNETAEINTHNIK